MLFLCGIFYEEGNRLLNSHIFLHLLLLVFTHKFFDLIQFHLIGVRHLLKFFVQLLITDLNVLCFYDRLQLFKACGRNSSIIFSAVIPVNWKYCSMVSPCDWILCANSSAI